MAFCYHAGMTISMQGAGALYTVLLFVLIVLFVIFGKFARRGMRTKKPSAPPPEKKPPADAEPVYYIVEKKKKRAKASYSDPRRISFQD